jgi:hypothetical protein
VEQKGDKMELEMKDDKIRRKRGKRNVELFIGKSPFVVLDGVTRMGLDIIRRGRSGVEFALIRGLLSPPFSTSWGAMWNTQSLTHNSWGLCFPHDSGFRGQDTDGKAVWYCFEEPMNA